MKMIKIFGIILGISLLYVGSCYAEPVITLEKNITVEKLTADSKYDLSFLISNKGDTDLKITAVRTSCKCIQIKTVPTVISPKKSDSVKYILDTTNLYGKKEYSVFVVSEDKQNPVQKVMIRFEIPIPKEPVISVYPDKLTFSTFRQGVSSTRMIIRNIGGGKLVVKMSSPVKEVSFSESGFEIDSQGKKVVTVNLSKDSKLKGDILLKSNSTKQGELRINFMSQSSSSSTT